MQKYDIALKNVLTRGDPRFLSELMGLEVARFIRPEIPEVRTQWVDLLGEARDRTLFHVELQSTNDPRMAFRMLDYLAAIERKYSRFPRQVVLYVGEAPMKMESRIFASGLSFEVRMVDMRSLDGGPLLESDSLDDNTVSILARLPDVGRAVQRILAKIADSEAERCAEAFQDLTLLAGLRSLVGLIKEESRDMPILTDIMDHDLFGPLIRQGIATGRVEGLAEGRVEGERALFQKQVIRRFGTPPEWVNQWISQL